MDELPVDSTDVFQRNMLDRNTDRPDASFQNGKYAKVDSLCLAEFLGSYYVQSKQKSDNDSQPAVLDDELMESQHSDFQYNKTIPLMSSKQKLKRRKVRVVLRYHVPNANRNAEGYAHHMLFSFYPFRDEEDLKHLLFSGTYLEKLQQPEVFSLVHRNNKIMEPFSEFVDAAFLNISEYVRNRQDPFSQQENEDIEDEIRETVDGILVNEDPAEDAMPLESAFQTQNTRSILIQDEELNSKIRSLNEKQREIFNLVHDWSKKCVKNLSSSAPAPVDPLHIFLTGNAGCGKSFLVKLL